MANIDFPASPTDGQTFTPVNGVAYKWLAAPGIWVVQGGAVAVTNVSVVSANGLAGTVATPTSTPAITLSTTVTGMVKGNGTALSAATAGTDYMTPGNVSAAYQPLDADLTAVAALSTTGIMARTAANTYTMRTETGTAARITVTNGDGVAGNPTYDIASTYVGQTSITTLGTIATGTWNGTLIAGQYGGTGVANTGKTITIGGNLVTSGAFASTFTMTGTTTVTFPTTGTLATTSQLTAGTVTGVSVVSANGFAGTATATATPAITLSTTISGMLKGNATAISAAVAGTDYMTPTDVTTALGSYLPLVGGTLSGQLNSTTSLTGASTPALNIQQTWNNAATLFTGIYVNFTDTASNASSNLLTIQVGGANRVFVNKAGTVSAAGHLFAGAGLVVGWTGRSYMSSPADGQIRLTNNAQTDFSRLQFGGTTSAFPAIKRNLTALNFRLADDSADAPITAEAATFSGALAGTTATLSTAIAPSSNDTTVPTTAWVKANAGGGGASITVSTTPPVTPADGALWYYTDAVTGGGQLMIYYNDGTSSAWVPASASAVTTSAPPYGYLYGLTLSNNSTTGINFAPGQCADSTNVVMITNTTSINKLISATWAAGTGAGGLGTGVTRTASTWYHMFGGTLTTGGAFDAWYDTSITGANKPAAFSSSFRRLGSIRTSTGGTPPILAFTQDGDEFWWTTVVTDVSALATTGNRTMTVPTGIRVKWHGCTTVNTETNPVGPATMDVAINTPGVAFGGSGVASAVSNYVDSWGGGSSAVSMMTNTSAQLLFTLTASGGGGYCYASTYGWTDARGRNG